MFFLNFLQQVIGKLVYLALYVVLTKALGGDIFTVPLEGPLPESADPEGRGGPPKLPV